MIKFSTAAFAAALSIGAIGNPVIDNYQFDFGFHEAEARGGRSSSSRSSSRSSFSRSSRSSSSSGRRSGFSVFSSSKKTTKKTTGKVNTGKGTAGSSKTAKVATKTKKVSFSQLPKKQQQRQGKAVLKEQRQKFKKPPVMPKGVSTKSTPNQRRSAYRDTYKSNPVYNRSRNYDSSTYFDRRNNQYGGWNSSPPPYVLNSSPSFGMWDAMAMYWMIDMMTPDQSAKFAYNQQNNPDWQAAKAEMDKQGQTNAELQAKLSAMEAKVNGMTGTPDPNYTPPGIDGDLLLSAEAVDSARPDFKLCVGEETGTYFLTAALMSSGISKVNVVPVTTHGSGHALESVVNKTCDGAFVQADAYWNYIDKNPSKDLPFEVVMNPYKETAHLVCNAKGPKDLSDLDSDDYAVWFPNGSGASETWKNIVEENQDYVPVRTVLNHTDVNIDSYAGAMLKAKKDKDACFLYVGVQGSGKFTRMIEASAKNNDMVLIDLDDTEVLDTKDPAYRKVYTRSEIDESVYPNLIRNEGTFGFGAYINTYMVGTDIIIGDAWKDKHPKLYPTLVTEMMSIQPEIDTLVSQ